jgi:hypothetical protein
MPKSGNPISVAGQGPQGIFNNSGRMRSREGERVLDAASQTLPTTVIAGLDPAIHAISFRRTRRLPTGNGVDARVKPGHDG